MDKESFDKLPLVGPESEDSTYNLVPQDVKLSGGEPLYYALIDDVNSKLTLSTEEVQGAKAELYELTKSNPDAVLSCQDKSVDEAREILEKMRR